MAVDGWWGPVVFINEPIIARNMEMELLPHRRWWDLRRRKPETVQALIVFMEYGGDGEWRQTGPPREQPVRIPAGQHFTLIPR